MQLIDVLKLVVQLINCTKYEEYKIESKCVLSHYEKNFRGFNYILNTIISN